MRWVAVLTSLLAGCYSPRVQGGSPCVDHDDCPRGFVCAATATCERTDVDAACAPVGPEVCGDDVDQDCNGAAEACAANDAPDGALDITAGGTFTADMLLATNHAVSGGCGGDGGRDVFYQITVASPDVYYFDTVGSDFNTVLRVYPSACTAIDPAALSACADDACGGMTSQTAVRLAAGTHCVVASEYATSEPAGSLVLRVERAGRDGKALVASDLVSFSETAAGGTSPCGGAGPEIAYFFAACAGTRVTAHSCESTPHTTWDTVFYLVQGTQAIACNDDVPCTGSSGKSRLDQTLTDAGLYWLVADAKLANPSSAEHFHVYTTLTPP